MNATKEIAKASAIAGVIFISLALVLAPSLWWLAACASLPAGYFAFRFDLVRKTIPTAVAQTRAKIDIAANTVIDVATEFWTWLCKPHPTLYLSAAIAILAITLIYIQSPGDQTMMMTSPVQEISAICMVSLIFSALASLILHTLVICGQAKTKTYFDFTDAHVPADAHTQKWEQIPCTYKSGFAAMVMGLYVVVLFLVWDMWKFVGRFFLKLTKLVYCSERMVCGVSGTFGGAITFVLLKIFSHNNPSNTTIALAIFFGGVISSGIGALSWEFISKKLLDAPADNISHS